ncbi:MAG: hypothetical protein ACYC7J_20015 [Syntrophales bacterium]
MQALIAVGVETDDRMTGWLELDRKYVGFDADRDNFFLFGRVPVRTYHNYESFAVVMGKLDPELFFFVEKQPLKELTLMELKRAFAAHKRIWTLR